MIMEMIMENDHGNDHGNDHENDENHGTEAKLGNELKICYFLTCISSVMSARFQLEN